MTIAVRAASIGQNMIGCSMSDKHPSKYTPAEVYDLSDRLLFAGHECKDPDIKALLLEGGRMVLNKEATLAQIRIYCAGK